MEVKTGPVTDSIIAIYSKYLKLYYNQTTTAWRGIFKPRSSLPDVFCKKVFLKISQNSQENTSARASFL